MTLLLVSALLLVQITGLHCDARQSVGQESQAVVHVQHLGTSAACHEDVCARDLSMTTSWKSFDQGDNAPALIAIAFILLLPLLSRSFVRPKSVNSSSSSHSVFLRPPLRAPPL
jgi:hypothetical protein